MVSRCIWLATALAAGAIGGVIASAAPAHADGNTPATPENTVIVSSEDTRAFCADFSVFLRDLAADWHGFDTEGVPPSVRDNHLVVVGTWDDAHVGPLVDLLLTPEESAKLRQNGASEIFEIASPWHDDRLVLLAVGSDLPLALRAAEQAMTTIVDRAEEPGAWMSSSIEDVAREEVLAHVARIQALPEGADLPADEMRLDTAAKRPRNIGRSASEADSERFFDLLANGYCGYGYFGERGDFARAETDTLAELATRDQWSPDELARVIRENLEFVHDCHLRVGDDKFCTHQDFWYDDTLELSRSEGGFSYVDDGETFEVLSVDGSPVEPNVFPSLNAAGEPVYRLGALTKTEPEPVNLRVSSSAGEEQRDLRLKRSEFEAEWRIEETRIGGIPVIRAASFADANRKSLERFLETGRELRGEPYVILDIRGNGGGNTDWPKGWIARFTGRKPSLKQVLTELESRTSMIGRSNVFASMLTTYPASESAWVQAEIDRYDGQAAAFDRPGSEPYWSPPWFPDTSRIPNDTTLIVVVDRHVASSGEGLVSYLYQQVDNVVIVGENTMGALEFGQISYHQLPHSKLLVVLPIKLNLPLDLVPREEIGFKPDLWVPPADAVNYAVAAARHGTISTRTELPDGYFDAPFVPERTWRFPIEKKFWPMLVGASISVLFWSVTRWLRRRRSSGN